MIGYFMLLAFVLTLLNNIVRAHLVVASVVGMSCAYACYWAVKAAARMAKVNGRWNEEGLVVALLMSVVCLPRALVEPFVVLFGGGVRELRNLESVGWVSCGVLALFAWMRFYGAQRDIFVRPEWRRDGEAFLRSRQWEKMRLKTLRHYGLRCMRCGVAYQEIHVDHIRPRSKYPALMLTFENLQVLCRRCNKGKGNWDESDFRR